MAGRAAEPEVIWARPERTGRGPKPAYSRDDIVAAAVRIADEDGIDALSMRRLAAVVGCGTMSLYNYVPRKEDLYELMVDAVSGEYDLPDPSGGPPAAGGTPSGDWRADMLEMGRRARAILHRHPWVIRLMTTGYAFGPNALRFLEHCLACLDGLDLPGGTKLELIATVNGTVMTIVANELALAERARGLPWSEEQEQAVRTAYLTRRLAGGAYPRLAAVLGEGGVERLDPDEIFERTLGRALDSFVRG
ncbi:TetR/AcrR family transcriptional regulator [Streptomyces sp. NPDC006551]|uniref:TetR/AcrR family transcriptional regulator n=1 Tax=Streptomyces sp. NPDC006551 TaxID=3157178 RepID=UPI0033ADEBC3